MISIIGAVIFFGIALLTMLVALGFPLGAYTMGGQYRVLPNKLRVMAVVSLMVQIFAMLMILQAGGHFPRYFTLKTTKYICLFFAGYLSLNTVMNFISKSPKEKKVMTPLSLIAAICYWIVGLQL